MRKAKDWVKSERKGLTGIGHTLEKFIGLRKNNIAYPDLGTIESETVSVRHVSGEIVAQWQFEILAERSYSYV